MTELIIQTGKHKGRVISLPEGEISVGNAIGCQIRLISGDIADKHCVIDVSSQNVQLRPVDAESAVHVNNKTVSGTITLKDADVIRIGDVRMKVSDAATRVKPATVEHTGMDNDIASWLDDTGGDDAASQETPPSVTAAAGTPTTPKSMEKQRKFDSVAEEGADIIRRYLESVGETE